LGSLEEFRKNPHVQIPSKSPCKISQNLAKIQIHFKFETNFRYESSSESGPASPARPTRPEMPWTINQKAPSLRVCAF
jgi:hypothetical protein